MKTTTWRALSRWAGAEAVEQPQPLLQRREGAVLVLSNNNPAARNALSPAFYAALTEALAQAEADPTVGAIVLTGEGGHFCAGGAWPAGASHRPHKSARLRP